IFSLRGNPHRSTSPRSTAFLKHRYKPLAVFPDAVRFDGSDWFQIFLAQIRLSGPISSTVDVISIIPIFLLRIRLSDASRITFIHSTGSNLPSDFPNSSRYALPNVVPSNSLALDGP